MFVKLCTSERVAFASLQEAGQDHHVDKGQPI